MLRVCVAIALFVRQRLKKVALFCVLEPACVASVTACYPPQGHAHKGCVDGALLVGICIVCRLYFAPFRDFRR